MTAFAQSIVIPTQGRLLDENDLPVTARLPVTFSIYSVASGGTAEWSHSTDVTFDQGFYALQLGESGDPIPEALFATGEGRWLGVKIGTEPELEPRTGLGWVPFAVRAATAASVKGGTIEDATITGGSIAGASIAATSVTADSISIGGRPVGADSVSKGGDTMEGPLTAPVFVSNTTTGAPLQVTSTTRVDNLNAELLDGHKASDFARRDEVLDNLVNNGGFENWKTAATPNWWATEGTWNAATGSVLQSEGFSGKGIALRDSDFTGAVAVKQVVFAAADASLSKAAFSLSVRHRRKAGAHNALACIREAEGVETCSVLPGSEQWTTTTVTHTTSEAPAYLWIVLQAGEQANEAAEYEIDEIMLVKSNNAVGYRPSRRDDIPSGMLGLFPFACPAGWEHFGQADGRTLVGARAGGTFLHAQGGALGDKGTRVITEVPRHKHSVNPPNTKTTDHGGHVHSIDPPDTSTTEKGSHTHPFPDNSGWDCNGTPSSVDRSCNESGNRYDVSRSTSSAGDHVHTVNIAAFNSASGGAHSHDLDIGAFDSAETGSTSVDVTMPYVQVAVCRAL